jgi:hypothetical protein
MDEDFRLNFDSPLIKKSSDAMSNRGSIKSYKSKISGAKS